MPFLQSVWIKTVLRCHLYCTRSVVNKALLVSTMSGDVVSNACHSDTKKPRVAKIGTHNGHFHCDEVFACYLLKLLPEYHSAEIVRSRNPAELDVCDIVVDVGGVFDPSKHRYDHHQKTFTETVKSLMPDKPWEIKLSSAGLVYIHFGHRIIGELIEREANDELTQLIFNKVYENFVREIDAIDNGVDMCPGHELLYDIHTNLSRRVSYFNPKWNEPEQNEWIGFQKAMTLVGDEFKDRVLYYKNVWWPARSVVRAALDKRFDVDGSGEIMCLGDGGVPWKEHLAEIEIEQGISPVIKFVLYTDNNGAWRVQAVPLKKGSFESRIPLKVDWRGVRDDELSKISGISSCIFVHASGFIGGNKTFNGALDMAKMTIKSSKLG